MRHEFRASSPKDDDDLCHLLERKDAVVQFQSSRLQQNDAILFLFGVNRRCICSLLTCDKLLLEQMSEELTHALLVTLIFKVHVSHEALWLSITVGTFEQHAQIVDAADVIFSDINDEARVRLLLNRDLTAFLFWPDLDARLRDLNLLLVEVRGDLDRGVAVLNRIDGSCNRILDVLVKVVYLRRRGVFVDNDASAIVLDGIGHDGASFRQACGLTKVVP